MDNCQHLINIENILTPLHSYLLYDVAVGLSVPHLLPCCRLPEEFEVTHFLAGVVFMSCM